MSIPRRPSRVGPVLLPARRGRALFLRLARRHRADIGYPHVFHLAAQDLVAAVGEDDGDETPPPFELERSNSEINLRPPSSQPGTLAIADSQSTL